LISGLVFFRLDLGELFRLLPGEYEEGSWLGWLITNYKQIEGSFIKIVQFGIPVVICYTFVDRPLRLALGVGAILFAFHFNEQANPSILKQQRSFFGVLQVAREGEQRQYHKLTHGTTLHGTQRRNWDGGTMLPALRNTVMTVGLTSTSPFNAVAYLLGAEADYWEGREPEWLNPRREALTYYHRTGPIGQVMRAFRGEEKRKKYKKNHIAVIGLGTGTMASYIEPGQRLTYYDIDKHVVDIARNEEYFTYLTDAEERGARLDDVVLGDARVEMLKAVLDENNKHYKDRYGVMVIDAFSSDAIPVHLITLEAIRDVYLPKLEEGGIIAFHISNRHLDLEPVLGNLAKHLGLKAITMHDGKDEDHPGKAASTWVLLAKSDEDFGDLKRETRLPWKEESDLRRMSEDLRGQFEADKRGFLTRQILRAIDTQRPDWEITKTNEKVGIWTDDFSNVLSIWTR
jgi:spermidine synthase